MHMHKKYLLFLLIYTLHKFMPMVYKFFQTISINQRNALFVYIEVGFLSEQTIMLCLVEVWNACCRPIMQTDGLARQKDSLR